MAAIFKCKSVIGGSGLNLRFFSTSKQRLSQSYKIVVVGGGAGGCSVAAKFSSLLPKNHVAIVEPSDIHFYQPMWTMVGGGMKKLEQSGRPMGEVLPKNARWIKERASQFFPEENRLVTASGEEINYDYLVIAMGLQLDYNKIKGLPEAFNTPGVCSNYSTLYVGKTLESLKNFKEGNAIFTFPNTPVKCAGAPQKAMYISEQYLVKHNKRDKANVMFNTSLGVIFGVKKYADALEKVVKERNIAVNFQHELVEVKPDTKEAVFRLLDDPAGTTKTFKYEMLHVTPPMSSPAVLRANKQLTNKAGYVEVDRSTLQHVRFPNIFGIGDCTSLPTSKTAAAVAGQNKIVFDNLRLLMDGKKLSQKYDGYTSCPLVTGYSKCILAEFDYDGKPLETLPINQAKERMTSFFMKKELMPQLYWKLMLNGWWNGPSTIRKILHLGTGH
ncbi:sulfide:quinone oxidoreductase, mitochondrial-like [Daphnia carinata]|uniref:sulfide:quinone oxidoreductase, mitochondrial-like n=1 Tax=Daphnia carinata TaxID=120202 RepID=UPI00257D51B6|nr:sulfide:quinone oxidoreductase, mitochondrial-like [Daphnia carinata]XP_057375995.1 sulfide:quinone oxidoreductase, mitochondrial-like [Daphnia carinata]XP_057375996.1 sulfide:quinone oxidoreductase, mitochondrial-like [Daphnia carinata]XP_057375997.1 sulfide:quinone oxidoreductase, mitochondrial-like [Daphnia carinata]XP_057375998.1 sulfide:quinone oxidoreductase, mitochondrial-like [Daphnia carinata]